LRDPKAAAIFLIVNGFLMLGFEALRRRAEARVAPAASTRIEQEESFAAAEEISFKAAALVGACQALALLPGISRSGVTIGGGLLAGLRHQEAARFSFLLATPIIAAAGVLEIPQLLSSNVPIVEYLAAAVLAGGAAYLSARFLLRYFRSGRLDPYGWYCAGRGGDQPGFANLPTVKGNSLAIGLVVLAVVFLVLAGLYYEGVLQIFVSDPHAAHHTTPCSPVWRPGNREL